MADAKTTKVKRSEKRNVPVGVVHINATFNNTIVTVTDQQGAAIAWSSSGHQGFKGSRKSTPFAAQVTTEHVAKKAYEHGMKVVSVEVKGPGNGRESALRALQSIALLLQA